MVSSSFVHSKFNSQAISCLMVEVFNCLQDPGLVVTKTEFVLVTESLMVEVAPSKERSFP